MYLGGRQSDVPSSAHGMVKVFFIFGPGHWSTTEACLFVGKVWISKNKSVPVLLLMHVDDLLIAQAVSAGRDIVMRTLEKRVKIRQTGHVDLKGGMLKFLGRNIARHGNQVDMWVDVGYLGEPLREFSLSRKDAGKVVSPPDLRSILDDETGSLNTPLSTEAHARFRRALGKLSWLAQLCFVIVAPVCHFGAAVMGRTPCHRLPPFGGGGQG